jgi:hypothetical protein
LHTEIIVYRPVHSGFTTATNHLDEGIIPDRDGQFHRIIISVRNGPEKHESHKMWHLEFSVGFARGPASEGIATPTRGDFQDLTHPERCAHGRPERSEARQLPGSREQRNEVNPGAMGPKPEMAAQRLLIAEAGQPIFCLRISAGTPRIPCRPGEQIYV